MTEHSKTFRAQKVIETETTEAICVSPPRDDDESTNHTKYDVVSTLMMRRVTQSAMISPPQYFERIRYGIISAT